MVLFHFKWQTCVISTMLRMSFCLYTIQIIWQAYILKHIDVSVEKKMTEDNTLVLSFECQSKLWIMQGTKNSE